MAYWFCSVFTVVCRKRLSSPRCRSELIDSAWVVIVPGQKKEKKGYRTKSFKIFCRKQEGEISVGNFSSAAYNLFL